MLIRFRTLERLSWRSIYVGSVNAGIVNVGESQRWLGSGAFI